MKLDGTLTIKSNTNLNGLFISLPLSARHKQFLEKKCFSTIEIKQKEQAILISNGEFHSQKIKIFNNLSERFVHNPELEKPYELFQDKLYHFQQKVLQFEQYGLQIEHTSGLKSNPLYGKTTLINLMSNLLKKAIEEFEAQVEEQLDFKNKAFFETFPDKVKHILSPHKDSLAEHRHPIKVYLYNILIALTLIGAILIVAKLAYSKITTGHAQYFFSQTNSSQFANDLLALSQDIANLR